MSFKVIDLFCGGGGMTLGFVDRSFCGGFECVLAVDNDVSAIATHGSNFRGELVCGDIEKWLERELPYIRQADVVLGGPPCQGFSLLNKKRRGDYRRALWKPYLEVVEHCGAKIFVMENVGELYRSEELIQIKRRARDLGFEMRAAILNAADFGAPQIRKRTLIVGWREANVRPPEFPPAANACGAGRKKSASVVADRAGDHRRFRRTDRYRDRERASAGSPFRPESDADEPITLQSRPAGR